MEATNRIEVIVTTFNEIELEKPKALDSLDDAITIKQNVNNAGIKDLAVLE
ncbi:MAG: hypothetical protein J6F30_13750 [Cellulosilyticum sp.]|nr:hypothetical protein [Cellulosilyticum sp.]